MKDFEQINFRLLESDNIRVEFFDSTQNASLLLVKIYGKRNSIINAFMPLENIRIGEDRYLRSYVLSDRNKYGLSTLWGFDLEHPREPIFYNLDDAIKYIEMKYLTE
jgi:hypothetical protein